MPVAAGAAALGIAGGIAGGQQDKSSQNTASNQISSVQAAPASADEVAARSTQMGAMNSLNDRLSALESSPALSNLDSLMAELGKAPTAARISQANNYADSIFAPQQTALDQSFTDQSRAFANTAAQMGRSTADPILAAKMAQEKVRQQAMLSANKGSFAAQQAVNMPASEFQNEMSAMSGLSQNAIQNRQAVYSMGNDFANTQMNFRLATATRTNAGQQNINDASGGGFKGFLTGLAGGAGAGAKIGTAMFGAK